MDLVARTYKPALGEAEAEGPQVQGLHGLESLQGQLGTLRKDLS